MGAGAVLPGVELFATGLFRGKRWRIRDLEEMADNARKLGPNGLKLLHPPTVFGHEEDQPFFERTDWPAGGYLDPGSVKVHRYFDPVSRRIEGKLIGDLTDVPDAVAALCKAKRFKKVSAEIYDNFEDDFGNHYGKAIRRIALLGAEVPQVKRLKDLPDPQYRMSDRKSISRLYLAEMKPTGHGTTIYTFAEQKMERPQLIAAIQAALPGIAQATLDAMNDDQLADLVKNLPTPAAAAAPVGAAAATPAGGSAVSMADDYDPNGGSMYADMPREDLIDALTDLGQDPNELQGMADDELQALYDELSDQGSTDFADDPAVMGHDDLVAALTQAGQDPTTLAGLSDGQLQQLYTQLLGGAGGVTPSATMPSDAGATAMADCGGKVNGGGNMNQNDYTARGTRAQRGSNMSEPRRMLKSARKLHNFAEQEYRRVRRQSAERRKQDAEAFCDRLVGEGRATPTLKQTVLMPLLLTLDDSHQVWQFAEGGVTKTLTAYEVKKAQLAKGPVIVRMGERFQADPAARKAGAASEVNKVEKFAEMYGDKLKTHGFNAPKVIELAKKMAERDPNFKAATLIGEDAVRMLG